jgi:hypothetical protein
LSAGIVAGLSASELDAHAWPAAHQACPESVEGVPPCVGPRSPPPMPEFSSRVVPARRDGRLPRNSHGRWAAGASSSARAEINPPEAGKLRPYTRTRFAMEGQGLPAIGGFIPTRRGRHFHPAWCRPPGMGAMSLKRGQTKAGRGPPAGPWCRPIRSRSSDGRQTSCRPYAEQGIGESGWERARVILPSSPPGRGDPRTLIRMP